MTGERISIAYDQLHTWQSVSVPKLQLINMTALLLLAVTWWLLASGKYVRLRVIQKFNVPLSPSSPLWLLLFSVTNDFHPEMQPLTDLDSGKSPTLCGSWDEQVFRLSILCTNWTDCSNLSKHKGELVFNVQFQLFQYYYTSDPYSIKQLYFLRCTSSQFQFYNWYC